jgi:magnesium transporter
MDIGRILVLRFAENHPAEAARVLERFRPEEGARMLESLPPSTSARLLELMGPVSATECLASMAAVKAGAALSHSELDSAASLARRLDPEIRTAVLEAAPADFVSSLRLLLSYPEGTAGALMDPRALAIPRDLTVSDSLEQVRRSHRQALHYLYVIDRAGKLVGVADVRELLVAPPHATVEDEMRTNVTRVPAGADRSRILAHPGWSQFHALPVVDEEGRLLGALRYETLKRLESETALVGSEAPLSMAVSLGELYWVGLSGLLEGLGHVATRPPAEASSRDTGFGEGRDGD